MCSAKLPFHCLKRNRSKPGKCTPCRVGCDRSLAVTNFVFQHRFERKENASKIFCKKLLACALVL